MHKDIHIERVTSVTGEVRILVGELDAELSGLYKPEQRHGLGLNSIFQPHIHFFLARVNGVAVGCGGVALFSGFAEIKRMYVRNESRRLGVADVILKKLTAVAADAGLPWLRLETGLHSTAAIKFYRRNGFRPCAAFDPYASMPPHALDTSVFFERRHPFASAQSALLRAATPDDLPGILAIYNDAVLNTTAIWNDRLADLENRRAWLLEKHSRNFPVIVARGNGEVVGYASFGEFRTFDGYRHTVEHSVYVAEGARRKGLGKSLLEALFKPARELGKKVLIGGIAAENTPSLALHAKLGFFETGRLPGVGTKFGRRLDLVFMQKEL